MLKNIIYRSVKICTCKSIFKRLPNKSNTLLNFEITIAVRYTAERLITREVNIKTKFCFLANLGIIENSFKLYSLNTRSSENLRIT